MNRAARVGAAATAVGAAAVLSLLVIVELRDGDSPNRQAILAATSDHLPNESATDWVTYADHVVVVTPVSEQDVAPAEEEITRGEGVIDRMVALQVKDVLWSRSKSTQPAPSEFDWLAWGWQFSDGDTSNRVQIAGEDAPRLELGHQYIMALVWEAARCSPGDDRVPAQWRGLGADSNIPYDDNIIGQGELQGDYQSAAERRAHLDSNEDFQSLEDKLTGSSGRTLTEALKDASPAEKGQFTPPAPCD